jgi:CheY-like chemotaxis protein
MTPRPVLYAEDEENDVFLMQRAFRKASVSNQLLTVGDGAEAIHYLEGSGRFADRTQFPLPSLLLLDLNLPRQSGLEVLKWVRAQPEFALLPVVILTSSNQERDIGSAYALGANGYLVKPPSSEKLIELVASMRDVCLRPDATLQGWLDIKGSYPPPAR